jgi:hypothetical protein
MLKTSLVCLLIAIIFRLVFAQTVEVFNNYGKQDDHDWKDTAKQVFFTSKDYGRWLTIARFDTTSPDQTGFHPSFTYGICKYKPIVKKLKNGYWQISFTSPIAENIP